MILRKCVKESANKSKTSSKKWQKLEAARDNSKNNTLISMRSKNSELIQSREKKRH